MFIGSLAALVLGIVFTVIGVMQNSYALQEYTDYSKELPQPGLVWIILGVIALSVGAVLLVLSILRARKEGERVVSQKGFSATFSAIAGALPRIFTVTCIGFTMTVLLGTLFARSIPTKNVYVLGLSFYLVTFLFYLVAGLAGELKKARKLNAVWYRLVHYLISAAALYLFYFVLWPTWRFDLREVQGVLDEGVIAPDRVIFGLIAFTICYFAVIGLCALGRKLAAKPEKKAAEDEYDPMVRRKK